MRSGRSFRLCAGLLQKYDADCTETKLGVMIGPTDRKRKATLVDDPISDTDSKSLFHFLRHCRIEDFRRLFSISHFSYSHRPIFTTLSEITDADKIMNPQHFGSHPADIRIRIWINSEI